MLSAADLLHQIYVAKKSKIISSYKADELIALIHNEGPTEKTALVIKTACEKERKSPPKKDISNYSEKLKKIVQGNESSSKEEVGEGTEIISDYEERQCSKKGTKDMINGLSALTIILVVLYFCFFRGEPSPPKKTSAPPKTTVTRQTTPPKDEGSDVGAYFNSKYYVKKELTSPSTAKFPSLWGGYSSNRISENIWLVIAHVDSQNAFGATIRTQYRAKMRYKRNSEWEILELEFF